MSDVSPGEIGGVFAGTVALLAMLGGGIKWLLGFTTQQQSSRQAKLDIWQDELRVREARIDAEQETYRKSVEADLADLRKWRHQAEAEHSALRSASQLLASALRAIDPENQALRMADELLRAAFPLNPIIPSSIAAVNAKLDEIP